MGFEKAQPRSAEEIQDRIDLLRETIETAQREIREGSFPNDADRDDAHSTNRDLIQRHETEIERLEQELDSLEK